MGTATNLARAVWATTALLIAAWAAMADDRTDCRSDDPTLQIAGCSALIATGSGTAAERSDAHQNRGLAYARAGRYDTAITDFDMAISLTPRDGDAWGRRGMCYVMKGDLDRALADLDMAIKLDPADARAHAGRGLVHQKRGDMEEALAEYDQATRLDPAFGPAYGGRAEILEQRREFDRALADYRKARALSPPGDRWRDYFDVRIAQVEMALAAADTKPTAPVPQKRVALVIGNAHYADRQAPRTAIKDSADMGALLERLGFRVRVVTDQDVAGLRGSLDWLGRAADGAQTGLVFYSGRALGISGETHLVPVDARPATGPRAHGETITLDAVLDALAGVTGLRMVLLDVDGAGASALPVPTIGAARSAGATPVAGTIVGFAARPATPGAGTEEDETRNSPYTAALLAHLGEPGLDAGLALRKVRDAVLAASGNRQEPVAYSTLPGRTVQLVPATPAAGGFRPETAPVPGSAFRDCDACPGMVVVPAGRFTMGSAGTEADRDDDEGPAHEVVITHAFAIGRTEVTFAEWEACVADGGCNGYRPTDLGWGGNTRPVINVNWEDARSFISWLNTKVTGNPYRLPSEAEWEYAARAGTTTAYATGETITTVQANFDGAAGNGGEGGWREMTVPAGSLPANGFGLHDMHGNVWEWVEDCRHDNYRGAPWDGVAWTKDGDCEVRMLRGGSWNDTDAELRSANREWFARLGYRYNDTGFRVARSLDADGAGEAGGN